MPPRAARSHSGSVGSAFPAHAAYASASAYAMCTTGCRARVYVAARTLAPLPACAGHPVLPAAPVVERHRPGRRAEHDRTGNQQRRVDDAVVLGLRLPLGSGDVARGLHETPELTDRDGMLVDPEPVD